MTYLFSLATTHACSLLLHSRPPPKSPNLEYLLHLPAPSFCQVRFLSYCCSGGGTSLTIQTKQSPPPPFDLFPWMVSVTHVCLCCATQSFKFCKTLVFAQLNSYIQMRKELYSEPLHLITATAFLFVKNNVCFKGLFQATNVLD